ncbi:MAG: ABC transporter ATP-binding protein [Euryarchaeota archaeon]|nr:ABC transporter ATP-binding protein [Euryarchaeota archaeon]
MLAGNTMLALHGLSKSYGERVALHPLTLEVRRGEILGIIGPNGAGKTTLLKLLTGLLRPTRGEVRWGGYTTPAEASRDLGYIPEESPLYEEMMVEDYLHFFAELYGVPRPTAGERIQRWLAALRLEPEGKRIAELSKGMRRKVTIARSLLHEPQVLIYDEPTSGLDPQTSRFILDFIRGLRQEGRTVLFSAHNLFQVEQLCDRILILHRGHVQALGPVSELREKMGGVRYTLRLQENGGENRETALTPRELQEKMQGAQARGAQVLDVEKEERSLEEMFLEMVKDGEDGEKSNPRG